ncbi:MAG: 3,4-dihydroxy-2-butanone-4-phosphate synthase [Azonexaceae bacterium]|uniref:bifunctional 3,4-dihydroxy-2-butanone-4-phosphate synthase/GTP cyclohydrolase II n=1 Tax=Azonexus sp. R2A61 TaxID=2744443 RepID=UPI001EED057D|nr:bifunctional 3,4-dihydroxy-2-butanone-4-phosphate synthase/GTP cyclohydrolase II [Azonexus sp. R2A61]MCE1239935.1 3,4-dihydroxy-2-butanone-4-phosphate synthase [Azonexaceae bacterium]
MPPHPAIASTEEIVAELKAGRMVVLVDEEDRENEGDLLMAAEYVTPEAINFMAKHGRGLICLTLTEARCKRLGLSQMARSNGTQFGTAFTVSIEAAEGVTTGISAADRAHTIRTAVARNAVADDIVQPGHVFPITAREGGVLVRAGHTEAGCDLSAMAGCEPAAVICEIMNDDGTMARLPELIEFSRTHGLKIGTIADLIHYRAASETLVERVTEKTVATPHGDFQLIAYVDRAAGATHLAMVKGSIPADGETLVRVHEPLSVLDFLDPDSKAQSFSIDQAQAALARNGHGVIVLMHRPEDGEALLDRLTGRNVVPRPQQKWDPRTYGIGAQILRDLGVTQMRLLASQRKMPSMAGFQLEVTGFVTSPTEL